MKKSILVLALTLSVSALAESPQFDNLSENDVKNITREFGANFSHTVVAAPETDGLWGVEIGLVAGRSSSPELSDVIEASGGNGSDFKNLYHAGIIGRAHFPLDLFVELNLLPEQNLEDMSLKNSSFGFGWNAGSFFGLPLDIAVGAGRSSGEISFTQTSPVQSLVTLETTSLNYWVGVSKTFVFVTPYLKVGASTIEGDLVATGSILGYTSETSEKVKRMSGGYVAAGANFQLAFLKLGVEGSKLQDVSRLSAKLSLDF